MIRYTRRKRRKIWIFFMLFFMMLPFVLGSVSYVLDDTGHHRASEKMGGNSSLWTVMTSVATS